MHYFLDLDNTVTASRSKISSKMKTLLKSYRSLVIVSGASEEQMRFQLDGLDVEIMSQNGNVNALWQRYLKDEEASAIMNHINLYAEPTEKTVENRGAQISYSFTGHKADLEIKKAFDPQGNKRRAVLKESPPPEGIEARIAGTTCIDYFPLGLNKGHNVYKFVTMRGWNIHSCVYVGDALFAGGNDESVIGAIPTFPVEGPEQTYNFMLR